MHRAPLLQLLESYLSRFPDEEAVGAQFCDFIRRCEDCFERSLEEGHITGSAWVVDSTGEKVLLTHHRKLNIWVQPGGHADGNADVREVALQEALEETGLDQLSVSEDIFDIDIHRIPARKNEPEHLHYDVRFLVRHEGDGDYVVSEESHDLAWVTVDRIDEVTTEESMLRMADKWRRFGE